MKITLLTLMFLLFAAFNDASAAGCPNGTAASYAGLACQQLPVHLYFPRDFASIKVGGMPTLAASQVAFRLDPKGPHTILISAPPLRDLKAGQTVDMTFTVFVSGSSAVGSWLHGVTPNSACQGQITGTQTVFTNPQVATVAVCDNKDVIEHFSSKGWEKSTFAIHAVGPAKMSSFGIHY